MPEHQLDPSDQKTTARRHDGVDTSRTIADGTGAVHSFLRLQSQVGNAHIARLLAQREAPDEDEVQAKHETVGIEGGSVGPDTTALIHSKRGGGSPLDEGTRTTMESSFGTSFSDVRVHADAQSDTLNRRLTARAFTTGSDIFLRRDASPNDTRLIAHELTHVVQQRSMSGGGGGGMSVGAADDGHERHADAVAEAVTSAPAQAQAKHIAQRAAPEEEEVQAQHDASVQREAPEEKEVQAQHDPSLQREAPEEEEVQASHDASVQREAPEEEEVQALHDPSVQRESVEPGVLA